MAKQGWHPADIKAALEKAGFSMNRLDLHHNLTQGTTRIALHRAHVKAEQIIAGVLGVSPQEIWPHRFDDDGKRLKPQPPQNYGLMPDRRHRKIGDAA